MKALCPVKTDDYSYFFKLIKLDCDLGKTAVKISRFAVPKKKKSHGRLSAKNKKG